MGRTGSQQHEQEVIKAIKELRAEGYKVIDLKGLSPDAIAVKDNKICAVEILGFVYGKKTGWIHKNWTYKNKKSAYSMFDKVIIKTFNRLKELK